jgi:hypothetical protein
LDKKGQKERPSWGCKYLGGEEGAEVEVVGVAAGAAAVCLLVDPPVPGNGRCAAAVAVWWTREQASGRLLEMGACLWVDVNI